MCREQNDMKELNEMTYRKYIKSMYRLAILYVITDLMFSLCIRVRPFWIYTIVSFLKKNLIPSFPVCVKNT